MNKSAVNVRKTQREQVQQRHSGTTTVVQDCELTAALFPRGPLDDPEELAEMVGRCERLGFLHRLGKHAPGFMQGAAGFGCSTKPAKSVLNVFPGHGVLFSKELAT